MDFENQIEKIAKDIRDREDMEMALAFTNVVGSLLIENGVFVKTSRNIFGTDKECDKNKYIIKKEYGISIDGLDFTEHDKVFDDKIELLNRNLNLQKDNICEAKIERNYLAERFNQLKDENDELKQRIAELESKETVDLPFDPLECANYLINATYERETNGIERTFHNLPDKVNSDRYTVNDLEQIAEHLLVYCKHNKECEE